MTLLPPLKSLQARLLALLLLLVTLVWLIAAGLTWLDTQHELDELLDGHLAQSAALLVAQQTGHGPDDASPTEALDETHDDTRESSQALHKYSSRVTFQVFHEGRLTLRSSNAPLLPMTQTARGFETVRFADQTTWRVFAARGNEGDVQVFVGEQVSSRQDILLAVLKAALMPLLYALPLLALVGWLAVQHGLAPLRALSQVLGKRPPHELTAVTLKDTPSEIEPVLQSLNALFDRIAQMLASERRFTADAAHELRTPIAAIRMQAQVAQGADGDSGARAHALQQTLAGCDRATHLVGQLLTLSRLEAGANPIQRTRLDLSALAQRAASDLALHALERQQLLELDAPQICQIVANEALVLVLLRNLLDNALRYSPDGSRVLVTVSTQPGAVVLQVQDSGPGLSERDMARLGERFFRGLGTGQTGSGLGWSIVKRIAAVHEASVDVTRSSALGGLCVQVRWPA